jgi:hypothetical protein
MTTFTLDTSGWVDMASQATPVRELPFNVRWSDLDAFTQGYVEALFASVEYPACQDTAYLPKGFSDLVPEALAMILADCGAAAKSPGLYGKLAGHGALFWSERQRGLLNEDGPTFPPLTVSLGDDGKVRLS